MPPFPRLPPDPFQGRQGSSGSCWHFLPWLGAFLQPCGSNLAVFASRGVQAQRGCVDADPGSQERDGKRRVMGLDLLLLAAVWVAWAAPGPTC